MPERPFDCSECKRPIAVCYTEIVDGKMTRTIMCAECPHLEKKLYGTHKTEMTTGDTTQPTSLVCANCNTSLEEVRMGHPLGCAACYNVFSDVLVNDLLKTGRISHHLAATKQTMPLHIGRRPGEVVEISPTLRLIALNEALDEMLIREDYEQAALLRDQIKALKEKSKQDDRKK
jgi:protein arginine kinase activator